MMNYLVDFPYSFNAKGYTSSTDLDSHIKDLIKQVLFTSAGERVNRPSFGSGVMQLLFAPNSFELGAATQVLIDSALQEWLGDLILLESVTVDVVESTLSVTVVYVVRRSQTRQESTYEYGATT